MPKPQRSVVRFKPREPMTATDRDYNRSHDPATQRGWVDYVKSYGRGLTSFEQAFIISVDSQLDKGRMLNDNQIKTLENIYASRTD